VVLSTLLGSHPPTRSGASLVAVGELFGIPAGTVRVALSRLVADGELVGGDGTFDLAESFRGRQSMLDAGRSPRRSRWDGAWWTVVALSERRTLAERRAFRSAMVASLLGELRPDVWLRPANLPVAVDDEELLLGRAERAGDGGRRLAARPGWPTSSTCSAVSPCRSALRRRSPSPAATSPVRRRDARWWPCATVTDRCACSATRAATAARRWSTGVAGRRR
jgi:phenylacetic acid degradation operon negative regulatory protein